MKKILYFLCSFIVMSCTSQGNKINGVSFVGSPEEITQKHVAPLVNLGANWAAVMPFGFIKNLQSPEVVFNIERQWWGERKDGAKRTIELLQEQGIQVMLKPQLWVWRGEFTGNIQMQSEKDWKTLEETYEKFILLYAALAKEMDVPILCIGTELHTFVQKRSEYWNQLIKRIKTVYSGKLTYAENWDQFTNVPFVSQLDYIGIDAYFPLAESKTPSVTELKSGWQSHKKQIFELYQRTGKPILFTEYGYRSVHYTAKAPWEAKRVTGNVNHKAQEVALQVLYEEFWKEEWFAGGFLWKWFHNHDEVGGIENNRFTIQNKPTEALIQQYYRNE